MRKKFKKITSFLLIFTFVVAQLLPSIKGWIPWDNPVNIATTTREITVTIVMEKRQT